MPIWDKFEQAEESVSREIVIYKKKKVFLYNVRISNESKVLKQCLEFVQNDAKRSARYFIVFNAKFLKTDTSNLMELHNVINEYKKMLFSSRLEKFALIIKSFTSHRRVITLFDDIFDENKISRKKYNYFSLVKKDNYLEWLLK